MEQVQKCWEYNGQQYVLDLDDANDLARYEAAFQEMQLAEKAIPKDGPASEFVKAYCTMYISLFESLFGPGTAEQIVGGTTNSRLCEEAYDSLLDYAYAQKNATVKRRNTMKAKYAPIGRRGN